MQLLEGLNEPQRLAATAPDGPVLIVAGPGTGKTKTLTARIAYLIANRKAKPKQILALTFTKKAAQEMQGRIAPLLGKSAGAFPVISTFHAFCHELLGGKLDIVDQPVRLQIIKKLARPAQYKQLSARELGLLISRYKNGADDDLALKRVVRAYDKILQDAELIDFDDLLVKVRDLLQNDPVARHQVQGTYTHILVDEFQDTNRLQYELLQLLRGTDNLFVIGDPLQSIYGFRGASGTIFDQFRSDFPDAQDLTLQTNYRSTAQIVRLSNALFPDAPQLHPSTKLAGRVQAVQVLNEYSEAAWVLAQIQQAIGGGDLLHAVSDDRRSQHRGLKDFAILYRNRSAAKTLQKAVHDSGLPYQVVGDGSPYDQPQVHAIIALMRASHQHDQPAHEGFSTAEWRAVLNLIQQNQQVRPVALAEHIVQVLGFEQSVALQQFLGSLVRFKDLPAAITYFDQLASQQFYDPTADAITLLTIHASKGLEFAHVFLIGAEEGILPYRSANVEEEQRLFYVAATRAKQSLDIVYTKKRGDQPAQLSSFAVNIDGKVLPHIIDPNLETDQRRAVKRAIKRSQQSLF